MYFLAIDDLKDDGIFNVKNEKIVRCCNNYFRVKETLPVPYLRKKSEPKVFFCSWIKFVTSEVLLRTDQNWYIVNRVSYVWDEKNNIT